MTNENKRQAVHVTLLLFAFTLKFLSQPMAIALLTVMLGFVLFLAPKLKSARSHFYRPLEKKYSQGAAMYFLALILLALVFPPEIVAASWAILALGDGSATIIGTWFSARELPWNRKKTYAGSIAFVIFGTFGAAVLLKWMVPELTIAFVAAAAFKASLAAAIVETLPVKLNDNITVAVVSAIALSFAV